MNVNIEKNGNVTFIAEADDREHLADMLERYQGQDVLFLADMLDYFGYSGNNRYMPISPENVGALTDSPMFSDVVEHLEDGTVEVPGTVWWFPNYQVENFAETLVKTGQVTFTKSYC